MPHTIAYELAADLSVPYKVALMAVELAKNLWRQLSKHVNGVLDLLAQPRSVEIQAG
jgi:transcription termination factor NusB